MFGNIWTGAGLPELGPGPRAGVRAEAELDRVLEILAGFTRLSGERRELARALVLLWHDHLEAAHVIAQGIESPDGAFVHGIVHRREPDYGNAKYWFRRVGQHPVFPEIAKRAGALLDSRGEAGLHRELTADGVWDAFRFVDVCEQAEAAPRSRGRAGILREVQAIEMEALLEWVGKAA